MNVIRHNHGAMQIAGTPMLIDDRLEGDISSPFRQHQPSASRKGDEIRFPILLQVRQVSPRCERVVANHASEAPSEHDRKQLSLWRTGTLACPFSTQRRNGDRQECLSSTEKRRNGASGMRLAPLKAMSKKK